MIKPEQTKDFNRGLPEDAQDSVATLALSQLKNRSRLERIASGSVWFRLWWTLPLVVSVAMLGLTFIPGAASEISFFDTWFAFFLVSLIAGASTCLHSRIDAIYRLMKDDCDSLSARLDRIEPVDPESKPEKK